MTAILLFSLIGFEFKVQLSSRNPDVKKEMYLSKRQKLWFRKNSNPG